MPTITDEEFNQIKQEYLDAIQNHTHCIQHIINNYCFITHMSERSLFAFFVYFRILSLFS